MHHALFRTMKFFVLFLGSLLLLPALHAQAPSTVTLTPDSAYLLPAGGNVTLTASVSGYPVDTNAIGWTVTLPAGWAYVSGTGEPGVKPSAGTTGSLGWAYISIPAGSTSFAFTVSYPAGITANQTVTSAVIVRSGTNTREDDTPSDVIFQPAPPPVIGGSATASATYNSAFSYQIDTTSPIPITSYGATGLPTGLSVNASGLISGSPTQTGSFGVTLDAANTAGSADSKLLTLTVAKASASISLSNLSQTYDGTPKSASAATTPANLQVDLTYDGSSTAPTHAGNYAVSATVDDPNYAAHTTGSLVIEPAQQIITFDPVGAVQINQAVTLSATASSGLRVTFSLISGNATLSGATLTITGAGDIVVRATQVGNSDYLAASLDQTINSQKIAQTITFAQPPDKLASDGQFGLVATASSGLAVTFTIVSGPAQLAGSTVTLTGIAGTVAVRASQAGNATYLPATDVVRSFAVNAVKDRVFFGPGQITTSVSTTPRGETTARDVTPAGNVAAVLPAGSNTGSLLIVAPGAGINELVGFTLQDDGTFTTSATQQIGSTTTTVTCHGLLSGTTLSGTFDAIGFSFSTTVEPADGPSTGSAGLYVSTALNTADGTTYTIIGATNDVLVLVVTPTSTFGGTATLQSNGTFSLQTGNTTVAGTVNAPTTTVTSTVTIGDAPPIGFGGLKTTTTRTDRLINLSSRARVGAGEKLLISGFVIGGNTSKSVLVRAVGPGLIPLGVNTVLPNPQITIMSGGTVVASNDDWGSNADPDAIAAAAARVGAFALASGSTDATLLTTLAPGVYTALVTGGGEGIALAEIYDASENPQADYQRLINISARGDVSSGDNILIGGLVITGNSPKKVLIRGIGPTLATQGVAIPLADPVLQVFKGGTQIAANDNWSADATAAADLADAATKTGAFALPAGSKDAAVILTLAPGLYTVHIVPAAGTAPGIAMVEIYEVPE